MGTMTRRIKRQWHEGWRQSHAWWYLNRSDILLLAVGVVCCVLVLRSWLIRTEPGSAERDISLVLVGGIAAFAGNRISRVVGRMDLYREASYTERAKAVQELMRRARALRANAWSFWKSGQRPLPSPQLLAYAESAKAVVACSFDHRVWLGLDAVRAARAFTKEMRLEQSWFELEDPLEVGRVLDVAFERFVASLCLELGIVPEIELPE